MYCGVPSERPGLRHALTAGLLNGECDPKVGYHRVTILQQDVLRLDVAMDHIVSMRIAERICNFTSDLHRIRHR